MSKLDIMRKTFKVFQGEKYWLRGESHKEVKGKGLIQKFLYISYPILFNFTFGIFFKLHIVSSLNFSIDFGQNIQNQLTKSSTNPTATPTLCRQGYNTESKEFKLRKKYLR